MFEKRFAAILQNQKIAYAVQMVGYVYTMYKYNFHNSPEQRIQATIACILRLVKKYFQVIKSIEEPKRK